MRSNDTTLGGPERAFPATRWSLLLDVPDGRRERLSALLQAYWKPVYAYVRLAWRKSNEDAKDLTQGFFARLLENDRLGRIRAEGGRFRSYLKQALKNHLIDAERAADVRRPVEAVVPLDAVPEPLEPGDTPEGAYDRAWRACVMDAATVRLEAELKAGGKGTYAKVFRAYLLEEGEQPTYGRLAADLGIKESDVRNYLTHCRTRLRELVKAEIRETVGDERSLEEELGELLAG